VDSYKLASGGWKLSKDSVDMLLPDLSEVLASLPASAPVICFCVDNSAFFGLKDDGSMAPFSKIVSGDDGYHAEGELVVGPEKSFNTVIEQLSRIVNGCGNHPVFIISPLPRYVSMSCCDDPSHLSNRSDEDFFRTLMGDLHKVRRLLKQKLPKASVLDGMELVCGSSYNMQKAETQAVVGWATDPVHPNAHIYAKMALNLIEKVTPRDDVAEVMPSAGSGGSARKRKFSEYDGRQSGSSRPSHRSQNWKQSSGTGSFGSCNDSRFRWWNPAGRGGKGDRRGGHGASYRGSGGSGTGYGPRRN
jgi:hypothetical protein